MLLKAADKPGLTSCSGSCCLGLQQGQRHTREQDALQTLKQKCSCNCNTTWRKKNSFNFSCVSAEVFVFLSLSWWEAGVQLHNISVTHETDTTVQFACQNSTTSMLTGAMNKVQGGFSNARLKLNTYRNRKGTREVTGHSRIPSTGRR